MEINLNCPVTNSTSYGIAAINIILSLTKLGVKVNCLPISSRADFYREQTAIPLSLANGEEEFDLTAPSIRLFHQHSLLEHVGRGLNIGFPIFELDKFKKIEKTHLNSCDRLFVCSHWAKEVLENNGIKPPIDVVPLGVDVSTFYPTPVPTYNGRPFKFFFPGKFEYRKGFDVIMSAFEQAFTVKDNIEIIFLPQNLFINTDQTDQWTKYLLSGPLASKVRLIQRLEHHSEVASLMRDADCVVNFSRAEGWNMPLLEALSCGRSVIATYYSGQTEFLTQQNATLINVKEKEDAIDGIFFDGAGQWLAFNNDVIEHMGYLLRKTFDAGPVYNNDGVLTAKKFTWENTALTIIDILKGLNGH